METESNLVERARAGDEAALSQLVDVYAPKISRFGRKLCRNDQDAQDVVQQTLLSVVSRIGEFRGDSHFTSWLFAIARSHCIKLRTRGAAAVPTVDLADAAASIWRRPSASRSRSRRICRAVGKLASPRKAEP